MPESLVMGRGAGSDGGRVAQVVALNVAVAKIRDDQA